MQEYDVSEDQELAEAFSTIVQRKKNGSGKGNPGKTGQSFPFRPSEEMSFDQRGKESRKNAVKFEAALAGASLLCVWHLRVSGPGPSCLPRVGG